MSNTDRELVTDCGCKTCDHKIAEVMKEVVECDESLLRDMDDVRFYLFDGGGEIRQLIEDWRATAHETRHKTVRQGKLLHHVSDELEKVIERDE